MNFTAETQRAQSFSSCISRIYLRNWSTGMVERENDLTGKIISAAIEVHRHLGPGLLESAYEECLCHELDLHGLEYDRQKILPVAYKGKSLTCGYRLDIVVENKVILELKAVAGIEAIHQAQILTYLKMTGLKLGLIINFNTPILVQGIKRIVNQY